MAGRSRRQAKPKPAGFVQYVLAKGTSRLLPARVNKKEIRLLVNGPAMLFGSARILSSLDMADGATYHAWKKLAASLTCTSFCGHNGLTKLPLAVTTSRIGTHLEFSTGPMSMYQSLVVVKPRRAATMKAAIDEAFGYPPRNFSVVIVPEPATGHAEHDGSIFEHTPEGHHDGH
jgi:hypothetical protein